MPELRTALLTGWGHTAPTEAHLLESTAEQLPSLVRGLDAATDRRLIARGLGRSYGDAAQNAGGLVLAPLPSAVRLELGATTGPRVRVSAGTSLHELIRELLPTGHFVPVTPGTRYVTIGGAVAANVHGKNHHRDGSFGSHLESLDLLLADGTVRTVGPEREPELFWATVGGMGLTGIVLEAVLRVRPVETGWVRVRTERLPELDAVLERMEESDERSTYSVAWIDTMARGRRLGRSVLTTGEHAASADLRSGQDRWALPRSPRVAVPVEPPVNLVSRPAARAFNELWFRKAPRLREGELQTTSAFFHPLDAVAGWNRAYGRRGLLQYQLVLPDGAEAGLRTALTMIAESGHPSFLSVLKRFGPGDPAPLSFPLRGWTLAVDLPRLPSLASLFARLDALLLDHGGRLYLAKDSRMSAATFARMYPRAEEFREVRRRVDPAGLFRSDLSRRLEL